MPLPRPIATIPYKNETEERIPPFAVLQFTGEAESTDTYITARVTKTDSTGKHFSLDNGKGALASESGASKYCYGECIKALTGVFWAHYVGTTPPATAWVTEVGPVAGEWYVNDTGSGFVYAGLHDPENERIQVMQLSGGGNNCTNIRFQILVADAVTRTALCVILSRPYGCGIASVPNTVSDGYAIEVCDPAGCFLNDPEEVLVGRDGWAHYMEPIPGSTWCQDGTYELQPEWQVYSLCCQVDRCFL